MEFEWTGDLDDDCVCRVPGYLLHAEAMDDHVWFCSVSRTGGTLNAVGNGEMVFHATDDDILPLSGRAARKLAEMAVMADMRVRPSAAGGEGWVSMRGSS